MLLKYQKKIYPLSLAFNINIFDIIYSIIRNYEIGATTLIAPIMCNGNQLVHRFQMRIALTLHFLP